ncbi:AAA family ATPase [Sphingomonas hengshuiensis]|uniref:AAA+ ATPase domain-containing protein n=1 Tax=Sphingomonas hengshuiensis TaxID=1609977 RepID=A0A7U4LFF3_9SPHN|nr:AAA family ATPase [Sphingomonas hengshuiensis]AJP72380.1 hypothetical protein TS85_12170 [Sphingomonas hengshuiensis]
MYDDHYGLSGRPFQLTPDPRFWFETASHRKAMAYLGYGLSQGEGFVVITGDPGAGKTTLMGHLLGEIDSERLNVLKIVSSQLGPDDLLRLVCAGLNLDATGATKATMLASIERALHEVARSGRRTLLIVDEAQALALESLEELRMLSNFQASGYALLQIFLLGQPEFRATLGDAKLEQLRQRVIATHHLEPMNADEAEPYLIHRLSCVGWRGKPRFTNDAVAAMYRWSGGSPRRLNQLASRVLLFGAIEQIETFGHAELAVVIADLDNDTMPSAASAAGPSAAARAATPAPARAPWPDAMRTVDPYELSDRAPLPMGTPTPAVPPAPAPAAVPDAAIDERIANLERQMQQQDEALRRVLTLLVDWVESGEQRRPDISAVRGTAA